MNQWLKHKAGFLGLFVVPMSMAIVYYTFIAANRYVSETVVSVRQANSSVPSAATGLAMLVGASPSSREDTLFLREYIHSLDMLKILDQKLAIRQAYASQTRDPFYRLYDWMSQEWYLQYYRNRVEVVYDDMTGLLRIRACLSGGPGQFQQILNPRLFVFQRVLDPVEFIHFYGTEVILAHRLLEEYLANIPCDRV